MKKLKKVRMNLLDETLYLVCTFLQEFTGGFQTEGGGEEESVRGTELDCTCSHLDDEHPLVVFHHLELVITEVEDVIDGLCGECTIGRHQELGSRFLVSQDDGTSLASDGVDPEILGEGHASVRVGGYLLGGQSDRGGDDGGEDECNAFHICGFLFMSVDFRLDIKDTCLGIEDTIEDGINNGTEKCPELVISIFKTDLEEVPEAGDDIKYNEDNLGGFHIGFFFYYKDTTIFWNYQIFLHLFAVFLFQLLNVVDNGLVLFPQLGGGHRILLVVLGIPGSGVHSSLNLGLDK